MFRESQAIGPYILIKKLGKGGFGEVWLAEKRTKFVTTKVAVKLPLDDQIDHEAIKHEATLWEKASGHPNILPIIDADEYDGQVVIVSEYAPDGSLAQWLDRNGSMPVKKAIEMMIQILDGLEFLHSRRIIHRDLKPANILLQGKTPRLADFGISRALRTTMESQSQQISGTFAYMSPEALDGKRSVQTDIWSVGVNLYQFLSGTLPFPQQVPSVLIASIMMRDFEPLPDFVPFEIRRIVTKALAKLPEDRYKTADELRHDLQLILNTGSRSERIHDIVQTIPVKTQKSLDTRLIPYCKGEEFGFCDVKGKLVIPAEWDFAYPFSEGLASVQLNSYKDYPHMAPSYKAGYINEKGAVAISVELEDKAEKFIDGLARISRIRAQNMHFGFINTTGKFVIPQKYDQAFPFSENLTAVRLNGKFGFLNRYGDTVIPLMYEEAFSFSEGLAQVKLNNKYGFIDKANKIIVPFISDKAMRPFSEGLVAVSINNRFGFIDKTGKEVIPFRYEYAYEFSDGLASVKINGKFGFIDKMGNIVILPKFDQAYKFCEGFCDIKINGKWGFIDKKGNEIIPPRCDDALPFADGLAMVQFNGKKGFIDTTGKLVIPLKYDFASDFNEGLAGVKLNDIYFYIDKSGTEYYEP